MENAGKLVLRLAVGVLLLLHGVAKLNGVDGIGGMLVNLGLPAGLAYLVYVGEIVAPVLIIIGLFARPAAAVAAVNMIVAVALVHAAELGAIGKNGGYALELQALYFFGAVAISLLGAGCLSADARLIKVRNFGLWNRP
jgi:putative oxidoreductase